MSRTSAGEKDRDRTLADDRRSRASDEHLPKAVVAVCPHDEEIDRPLPGEFEKLFVFLAFQDEDGAVDLCG